MPVKRLKAKKLKEEKCNEASSVNSKNNIEPNTNENKTEVKVEPVRTKLKAKKKNEVKKVNVESEDQSKKDHEKTELKDLKKTKFSTEPSSSVSILTTYDKPNNQIVTKFATITNPGIVNEEANKQVSINQLSNLTKYNPTSFLSTIQSNPTQSNPLKTNNYNVNMALNNALNVNKVKQRKLIFPDPPSSSINFVGLIIGPKGIFLRTLEELSKCKIKVRGKGTCKNPESARETESEPTHAVFESELDENLDKAQTLLHKVLTSDLRILEQIKDEQHRVSKLISPDVINNAIMDPRVIGYDSATYKVLFENQENFHSQKLKNNNISNNFINNQLDFTQNNANANLSQNMFNNNNLNIKVEYGADISELGMNPTNLNNVNPDEMHLISPYGKPSPNAKIIPVPNDCVGLLIGKSGETIKKLIKESSCKILIAIKEIPNTETRNIFIEGENFEVAKRLIEEIVAHQQKVRLNLLHIGENNPFPGPYVLVKIPNEYAGLIIGKSGEQVKKILGQTNCAVFVPNKNRAYYEEMVKLLRQLGESDSITFTSKNKPNLPFELKSNLNKEETLSKIRLNNSQLKENSEERESLDEENNISNQKYVESEYNEKDLKNENEILTYTREQILTFCNARDYKEINTKYKKNEAFRIIELSANNDESISSCMVEIQKIVVSFKLK